MKIIERWGSGIPRLYKEFKARGLQEPELLDMDGDFRVNLFRHSLLVSNESTQSRQYKLDVLDDAILDSLKDNPMITQKNLAEALKEDVNLVKYRIYRMRKIGIIEREGTARWGSWVIMNNDKNLVLH